MAKKTKKKPSGKKAQRFEEKNDCPLIASNERYISVLKEMYDTITMPTLENDRREFTNRKELCTERGEKELERTSLSMAQDAYRACEKFVKKNYVVKKRCVIRSVSKIKNDMRREMLKSMPHFYISNREFLSSIKEEGIYDEMLKEGGEFEWRDTETTLITYMKEALLTSVFYQTSHSYMEVLGGLSETTGELPENMDKLKGGFGKFFSPATVKMQNQVLYMDYQLNSAYWHSLNRLYGEHIIDGLEVFKKCSDLTKNQAKFKKYIIKAFAEIAADKYITTALMDDPDNKGDVAIPTTAFEMLYDAYRRLERIIIDEIIVDSIKRDFELKSTANAQAKSEHFKMKKELTEIKNAEKEHIKQIESMTSQITALKEEIQNGDAKVNSAVKKAVKEQANENAELRKQIKTLQDEKLKREQRIEELSKQVQEQQEETVEEEAAARDVISTMDYLKIRDKKIAVIRNCKFEDFAVFGQIAEAFPNAMFSDNIASEFHAGSTDLVLLMTRYCEHPQYWDARDTAKSKDVPTAHCKNTNIDLIIKRVAEILL